jgi:hypothetical protein
MIYSGEGLSIVRRIASIRVFQPFGQFTSANKSIDSPPTHHTEREDLCGQEVKPEPLFLLFHFVSWHNNNNNNKKGIL